MTLQELRLAITTELPDNDEGLITPDRLRTVLLLIVQAMAEGVDS
jgi:hypothetical protein